MLTACDIEEYPLEKTSFGGYKCESVDSFLDKVATDYQKLTDDNAALVKKISVLVDSINKYRQDEDYIKSTLIEAQKLSANIIASANDQAAGIIDDANTTANQIVSEATTNGENISAEFDQKIKDQEEYLEKLKVEVDDFRSQLLAKYKAHIESISELPTYTAPVEEVEEEESTDEVSADEEFSLDESAEVAVEDIADDIADDVAEDVAEDFVENIEEIPVEEIEAITDSDDEFFEELEEAVEE